MKKLTLAFTAIMILASCSRPAKDLASVEIGMTKDQVVAALGEPKKKDVINKTELWNYVDSGRTVVFRADTVYSIMTSPQARIDSVSKWLDTTNEKVKDGFGNVGEKIENAADKVTDQLKRDSTR